MLNNLDVVMSYKKNPRQQKMHILQPKQTKLSEQDANEVLTTLNISKTQLPKVLSSDAGLPEDCIAGDIVKIERKGEDGSVNLYYRVIVQ